MNRIIKAFIFLILLLASKSMMAQGQVVPDGILFQAVARDANNNAAGNRNVYIQIYIKKGTIAGATDYSESFKVVSSAEGIFSIIIGQGTRMSGPASLKLLDWAKSLYFVNIKIAIEPTLTNPDWRADNNYVDIGTSQLWTVPYAFASETSKYADSAFSISGILPGSKGGTGVANTGKTITVANNLITKGIGDLTITTTAASNVIFPTSGTLANTQYVSDRIGKDTISLSNRIDSLKTASIASSTLKLNISDTSAMLTTRIGRDTISLSNRINLKADKLNAKIDSSLYVKGKTTITDTLFAKANVIIDSNLLVKGLPVATITGAEALKNKSINGVTPTALANGFKVSGGTTTNTTLTVVGDVTVGGVNSGDQLITLAGDVSGSGTGTFSTTINTVGGKPIVLGGALTTSGNYSTTITTTGNTNVTMPTSGTIATLSGTESLTNKTINGVTPEALNTGFSVTGGTVRSAKLTVLKDIVIGGGGSNDGDQYVELTGDVNGGGFGTFSTTVSNIGGKPIVLGGALTTSGNYSTTITTTGNTSVTLPTSGTLATLSGTETLTNKIINGVRPAALANGFSIAGGTTTNTTLTVVGDVTVGGVNSGDQLITLTGDVSGSGTGTFTTTTNSVGGVSSSTISTVASNVLSATSTNTPNTIVKRDVNGDFSTGTITGTLSGTASGLTTARTISTTGDVTYTSPAFNGTSDVIGVATLANSGVLSGTYGTSTNVPIITVDSKGRITSATNTNIPSATSTVTGLLTSLDYQTFSAKQGALTAGAGITIASGTISATDATSSAKGIIQLTGDLAGTAESPLVGKIGGKPIVLGGSLTTSGNYSTTITTTGNTDVTMPTSGTIATLSGTETLTNKTINGVRPAVQNIGFSISGGTSTSTTLTVLKDVVLGGVNTGDQYFELTGDVTGGGFGTFTSTVTSVGGVSAATIATVASNVLSATSVNTPNTLVKRDSNGDFSTGTITGTLSGTASNANALTTGRTISTSGDVTYTSPAFNGTSDVTGVATLANSGVLSGTYGTSTSVPTITVDSKGRITSATNTIIPSATSTVTGLLTSSDYQAFSAKQGALTAGAGITIASGTISATDATSSAKGIIQLTGDLGGTAESPLVNNIGGKPITLGGALTTSGNYTTTITTTGNTNVTLPTSGTIATLSGTETLTNKTINGVRPTALATGFSIAGGTITNTTLTVVGDVTVGGVNSGDQLITLTGDVSGSGTGTFTTTTNSVGGVNSSTIATLPTLIASNTLSITSNTTAIAANTADILLRATIASPSFTGSPTAPTPSVGTQNDEIATTAFVATFVTNAAVADASSTVKGKLKLANDLGGTADLPTVNSVGGVSSSTITTVASAVNSATSVNTPSTIVKRDSNGDFSTGTITGTLSGTASNAIALTTGRTISTTGDVIYTSPAFNGTSDVTAAATLANSGVLSGTYGTSTSVPTITIDSKGRITNATTTNIPSATSTVTGLLTSTDYQTFSAKQGALTAGSGITIASGTISATDATSTAKGIIQLTGDLGGTAESPLVNNIGGKPITLGGALTTSGNYTTTITTTANTNVTLPTSGTIATLSGTESLTNKTINGVRPTALATGFSIAGGTITNTTLTVVGDVTVGGVNSGDQLITLTGDVSGSGTGTFTTTTNSVGGVSSSTITTVASDVLSATSTNTANTIVKRDVSGNFDAGTITATAISSGTLTLTTPLSIASGGTGTNTATGTGAVVLSTSPALTGTPTAITADVSSNSTQIATTAFVAAKVTGSITPDATATVKGKLQLTNDLGGSAEAPTVNSVGGVSSSTITTVASAVNSATSVNTPSTIVKRDSNGDFSTGTITGTLSGTASNANALTTGRTIGITGDITYTSPTFNGTSDVTGVATLANSGVVSNTYGTSTSIPTITVDSKGRITNASTTNIPSATSTVTGLLTSTDYAAFSAKQGALTAGSGISISGGTISATGITSANLSPTAGITNTQLANSEITLGSTSMSLGGTYTSVTGLSSVTSTSFTGTLSGTASGLTTGRTISTTGDVTYTSGAFNGTQDVTGTATINSVGGVNSSTITTVASDVLSATSTNTASTIVKRDVSGNFAAGTITATAISSGTLTLTTPLAITSGGTGTNTATGTGLLVLSTSPALTGTPTAPTASVISDDDQIATTAFVKASITNASVSDATATTKGILRLTNDLGGSAALPTVNSVGGVSSSTITTVASSVNSATSVNTPNTIVKRDNNGDFSTGTITGTLSGTASNATALTTGRTISTTGDVTYTSAAFNGTADVTGVATLANSGVSSGTYGTSTSVPTITVDSKGRITSATSTNIPSATSSVTGLLTSTDYAAFSAKQGALTAGSGISIAGGTISATGITSANLSSTAGITNAQLANSEITLGSTSMSLGGTYSNVTGLSSVTSTSFTGTLSGTASGLTTGRTISTTGDVTYTSGSFNGTANVTGAATVNSVGGVSSSTITTVASDVLSATSTNTANTIVKRDGSGNFAAGTITATAISSGTLTLTTPLAITSGGTGTNTATGTGLLVLSTSPALTGTPTAVTADVSSNSTQIATTAFVAAKVTGSITPDATATVKGKLQLTNDLGGSAEAPTVNSVGGVSSSTITTVASAVNSATSVNTPSTIVKRDNNGGFSTGTITGTLSGTASNATALTTGRTIGITGDITYTSPAFDGTSNITATGTLTNTGVTANTYGTSTSVPTITVDSKGRITSATSTNIPSATSTVTGLLTSTDYVAFSAKQGALTAGSGISISSGTISATGITSANLSPTAGITNAQLANSAITLGSTSMSLGGTYSNVTGLSSVTSTSFTGTLSGTASGLTTPRTISTTGDVTSTGSFDGTSNLSLATTLANSGVASGTYGSSSVIPKITVDAKGRVTSLEEVSVGSSVIGAPLATNKIIVGNLSNTAQDVNMSGDVSIVSTGATTVNNVGGKPVVLGGALTTAGTFITSGNFTTTITTTGNTNVTLPTSGRLATIDEVNSSVAGGATPDATATVKGKLLLTNDLGGSADLPTVNSVGGVSSSTITTVASSVNSATSSNTPSTIVKRDSNGGFSTGTITGTLSGTASNANALTTGRTIGITGDITYTSPVFNGTADVTAAATLANSGVSSGTYGTSTSIPTITVDSKGRITSATTTNIPSATSTVTGLLTSTDYAAFSAKQGALSAGAGITIASGTISATDATSTAKGIIQLTNDLGGSADAPTVNSVGGVSSSTITTVASSVNSATSTNTPNTIVKRDGSGGFSTGTITGTLSGTASNANALTTGRTIGITGDITYTSPAFDGTGNVTAAATLANSGVISNTYGTSTGIPTITVDSKGRITNASTTNIPSATSTVTGLLTSTDYAAFSAKQGALTAGAGITIASGTISATDATSSEKGIIKLTNDLGGSADAPTVNSVGGVNSSTITTVASDVLSATSTNTASTIVKRDGSGNFDAGTITATAISSGTLTLTTPLAITSGGTGTNTATGTGSVVLSTSPALTGTPTAITADVSSNSTQIATTAFVKASITSASVSDATATVKGILKLTNDLGGTAELPTVNSVGGVSSSTITTVASSVNSATSVNTPNTIVKRDGSGGFSTGTITGTLSGTASNATALTTGRTIGITGDITYTSPAFDGTSNITATGTLTNTGVTANTYGTSTSIPTITVDSKGRITSATSTNIPSATSTVTGLLTSTDYAAFSAKQGSLTAGSGISISGGTISATGITSANLSPTAGITNAQLANSEITLGSTSMSLGGTYTSVTGLSSVTSTSFTGTLSGTASGLTTGRTISTTGDVTYTSGAFNGTANVTGAATVNSVGGVNSSTITTVASDVLSATSTNTANTIVKRDGSGNFDAGTITATAISSGTLTLTTPLAITSGGTGTNTATGTGSVVLSTSPALTGTPTAITADVSSNSTQIATTAFVKASITSASVSDATATVKGILKLTNDLGGTAELPTVNSVGGVSSSTITTVASSVNSATSVNTPNTIVKRDGSGGFSTGTITGTLSGTASNATALTTGRTIGITGDITYTSPAFDGTSNITATGTLTNTGVTANTYGTSTSIPTITVDSKGRITSATSTNIPSATSTVTGLLTSTDYATFSDKQGALTAGAGITIASGTISATDATSTAKGIIQLTNDLGGSAALPTVNSVGGVLSSTITSIASSVNSATSVNTPNTIVKRDGSGNFAAGAITSTSVNTGTLTATSVVANTLKVTGGSYTMTNAVLTTDGTGNAVWSSNGLYTLNGITAASQTFSTTTTSTTTIPTFTSNGSVHTLNIPYAGVSGTVAGLLSNTQYQELYSKQGALTAGSGISISSGTISATGITSANLSPTAGITNAQLANSAITLGSTSMSLGGTYTSVTGLSSVTSTSFTGTLSGTASGLTTARTISTTGDVTSTGSFDGTSNLSLATTLANSGVASGTYGSSSVIPKITVDAKGRVTSLEEVTVGSSVIGAPLATNKIIVGNLSNTAQDVYMSGDVTIVSTGATTLANSGVASGTYGTSTSVPTITVDSKGRITSASNTNIPSATSSVTGLLTSTDYAAFSGKQDALTLGTGVASFLASPTSTNLATAVTNDVGTGSLVFSSAPTLTNATLSGTLTLTAPLTVANGGTGTSTYTKGDILYASATNTLSKLPIGTEGQVLLTTGSGIPSWGSNGLYSLNGLTASSHTFPTPTNTTTSDIGWTSVASGTTSATHTLNIPDASASRRGTMGTGTQTFAGDKTFQNDISVNSTSFGRGNSQAAGGVANNLSIGVGGKNFGANTTGAYNIAIGASSLTALTSGTNNNAVGFNALKLNQGGTSNNAFGANALSSNTSGNYNTAVGEGALSLNTGSNNTAVGWSSLTSNTSGTNITAIGSASGVGANNLLNATAIGAGAIVRNDYTIQLGNTEVTSVVTSGTLSATGAILTNLRVTGGSPGTGKVLISDGSGNAAWGSNGLYSLNGRDATTHNFATSTTGTDFTITSNAVSGTATHTFNLPDADGTTGNLKRGLLSTGTQSIAGNKTFTGGTTNFVTLIASGYVTAESGLKVKSAGYQTAGAVLTSSGDANGSADWSTNLNVGTITSTSLTTGALRVTSSTPTVGAVLTASSTDGTVAWSTSNSASSLAGGVAGAIPYQTAPNTTGFTAAGTSGQILVSGGTYTPTWTSNISVGTATATSVVTNTLKVTGGSYTTTNAVLTTDGSGNAIWSSNGLYTLNGISAAGQTFSTTTTATSTTPSFTSNGTVHTLNIPSASVTGTTAGLLSNAEYASLNAKQGALTAGAGITIASGTISATDATSTAKGIIQLTNDLGGTAASPIVNSVGGVLSSTITTVASDVGSATSLNTANTIVKRDGSGDFSTGKITATSVVSSGNISATTLTADNFTRSVASAPASAFTSTTATTINFSGSNLAYSGQSSNIFTLSNLKDGGTYTLAWQNTTTGLKATFSATGFNFVDLGNYTVITNKHAVYTFMVMGTTVYFSMISQQ